MIEDINCGQLFQRRSDWQEKAFNELTDDLTATKDNRFLKYQDENETYLVMICGKSQIGKSTLILKMLTRVICHPMKKPKNPRPRRLAKLKTPKAEQLYLSLIN